MGKNKHSWPAALIVILSIDSWSQKSSCCERSWAMQQFWLLKRQTGEHLAFMWETLNPCSSRQSFRPFASPSGVIISCLIPWNWGSGFDRGMTVFFCFHCVPPFDLFIVKALSASGGREAWADDWLKMNKAWHLGWATSKISIMDSIWTMSWSVSHQGSPLLPGKMTFQASWVILPFSSNSTNQPVSSLIKSETQINLPWPFFCSGCSPALSLNDINFKLTMEFHN